MKDDDDDDDDDGCMDGWMMVDKPKPFLRMSERQRRQPNQT